MHNKNKNYPNYIYKNILKLTIYLILNESLNNNKIIKDLKKYNKELINLSLVSNNFFQITSEILSLNFNFLNYNILKYFTTEISSTSNHYNNKFKFKLIKNQTINSLIKINLNYHNNNNSDSDNNNYENIINENEFIINKTNLSNCEFNYYFSIVKIETKKEENILYFKFNSNEIYQETSSFNLNYSELFQLNNNFEELEISTNNLNKNFEKIKF